MKRKLVYALVGLCVTLLMSPLKSFSQKATKAAKPAQQDQNTKKYPSLLWEITGNGLTKPSYLFGTMHISNKMVFNLSDSFYKAIKNVDVVALEQNPEYWQEAYSKENTSYGVGNMYSEIYSSFNAANERLTEGTFSISAYESKIQLGLASEAKMVNGMLYRNNIGQENFEEETYLDMYIYRLGRKLNKIVTGVEDYKESDKIVKEAYRDMYKDKKSRRYNYDYNGYDYRKKMEEAYRKGDLDVLDSLQVATSVSDAFNEKFLYKRNEIQANSIDTILKKHSLFVGVGAAHLAGDRGVIEMLRKKGYKLRPVTIGQRNSEEKDKLEKIRVPRTFQKQYAEDSLFSVEIPGDKFYRFASYMQTNMVQYADMANGSYYMVTRVKTEAGLFGNSTNDELKKIDSLLYENIPGKILSKKTISRNGFKGYDILNRTRKGDEQRYNVYALPNEIIFFKISGIADYVTEGKEADQFFSSVSFDSIIANKPVIYTPPYGGFTATFPARPQYIPEKRNDEDRSEWLSTDNNNNHYFIFKTTVQQYDYIEQDTFELRLMEESLKSSPLFREAKEGKTGSWKDYPVINAKYVHNDGDNFKVRYLIQGSNYYIIGAKYKNDEVSADAFINSFNITPTYYGETKARVDTALGFTVKSPVFYPEKDTTNNDMSLQDIYDTYAGGDYEDQMGSYMDLLKAIAIKSIGNDTTGEYITLVSFKFPKYTYFKDSSVFMKSPIFRGSHDSDYIIKTKKESYTANNWHTIFYQATDTASSRVITAKSFYKNGVLFYLINMGDSITPPGEFVSQFYETFEPADTFQYFNVFAKKSEKFFGEYFSSDTLVSKAALRNMDASLFDSSDLPNIKKAIGELSWKNKNYLSLKKRWIDIVGNFQDTASVNYLTDLYMQVKDTSDLQNAVLDALLEMRTTNSFASFSNLLISEPPTLTTNDNDNSGYSSYGSVNMNMLLNSFSGDEGAGRKYYKYHWGPLYDTLQLTAKIMPDLLDLMTLDDYKDDVRQLLTYVVDSGYVKSDTYKQYFNKFLLEAKQQLKKEIARESEKEMNKLENDDEDDNNSFRYNYRGNVDNDLEDYAVLLMPFWDNSTDVPSLFDKILQLQDKNTRLSVAMLMLRNKKAVPDSILTSLAADDKYRIDLYNDLDNANLTEKFPAKYKNQLDISKSLLDDVSYYNQMDTIVYTNKVFVNDSKYKGWLYFYKYKRSKDDKEWYIAYSGLQPADTSKIKTDFRSYTKDFRDFSKEVYNAQNANETQAMLLKKCLYALRESSSQFYGRYNDDDVTSAAVDQVKSGGREY